MYLTERHIIKKSNPEWKKIDHLCFFSKNLYNAALYRIKKELETNGKIFRYNKLDKEFKNTNQIDYRNLPIPTSQQILIILDRNFKSFFNSLRSFKKDKTKFKGCPKPPKYKDKIKGRNLLIFTYQQMRVQKDGNINFPKKTCLKPLKSKVINLQEVRIIPQTNCYVIEVIYQKDPVKNENLNNNNYLAIDLGVNNLVSATTNQPGLRPLLISGKVIKSINQYYNKRKSKLQSQLEKNHKRKTSKRTQRLTFKRNNKVTDYFHNISRYLINYCIENRIGNIVIGYNKNWKNNVNLGKINNQTFTQIPFFKLIQQLKYKAELVGINVIIQEESYTSKCSSIDLESIRKHNNYVGKRIKRGLFKTSENIELNSDVNGSLNILRKVIGDDFINLLNIGCVLQPLKINLYKF